MINITDKERIIPTYGYRCTACGVSWEEVYKIANRKQPEGIPCPHCQTNGSVLQEISAVAFGDPAKMGLTKIPDGWRDVLKKVHSKAAGSRLNETSQLVKI